MKRSLLALAFVAAAGAAGAQTAQTPEIANAPLPPDDAAAIAKKRIEMDGYKDVHGLARGADGLWQGTAMRGNTEVQVTVDRAGNVAAK